LPGESVDKRLIIGFLLALSDSKRLVVRGGDKFWGAHIWHPNLHRAQTLSA
jgi:hypothetical protein